MRGASVAFARPLAPGPWMRGHFGVVSTPWCPLAGAQNVNAPTGRCPSFLSAQVRL